MTAKNAILKAASATGSRVRTAGSFLAGRGQAAVEFALVATVAMIVLFVAVQLALIGEDALSLGQMNYQGARWFAVNTCATTDQVMQYMLFAGSPSITQVGGSCGTQLKMNATYTTSDGTSHTVTNKSGSTCTSAPTVTTGCANPLEFGQPVTITLNFDASKSIFLGNGTSKWMGLISFPTTLTSTETAMAE